MKKTSSYHILRIGLGLTFLWIGILILQDPFYWGGFIKPWAADLIPGTIKNAMISTAILDLAVGVVLLVDYKTWVAALIGSAHILIVLITVGIDAITVRDLGLLAGTISILWDDLPARHKQAISEAKLLENKKTATPTRMS
ncbi:hypothetical protein HYV73_03070 [Candidatus Uhrbacteria bacterium]|nr:hypothetical protein [Candidatus Uhrbacteria bacterium]